MKRRNLIKSTVAGLLSGMLPKAFGAHESSVVEVPKTENPLRFIRTFCRVTPISTTSGSEWRPYGIEEVPISEHPNFSHFDENGDPVMRSYPYAILEEDPFSSTKGDQPKA